MQGIDITGVDITARRRQLNVFMGIDTSASMGCTHREGLRQVTRQSVANQGGCSVVDALTDGDSITAYAFNHDVYRLTGEDIEPVSDLEKMILKRKINSLRPSGSTKLYDTINAMTTKILEVAYVSQLVGQLVSEDMGIFRLVILSDGEDTSSTTTKQEVIQKLQRIGAAFGPDVMKITFIGVQVDSSTQRVLSELASAAGPMATFHNARDMSQVTEAFRQFTIEFRMARLIGITSSGTRCIADDGSEWQGSVIQKGSHVRCIGHSYGKNRVEIGEVGVVKGRDQDGDYVVDFPVQDEWVGRARDLALDQVAEAVRPGALVTLKDSVVPRNSFERGRHGLVVKVEHDGVVFVQLGFEPEGVPGAGLWKGRLQELKVFDDGRFANGRGWWSGSIQLGQAVGVMANPSTGMGGLRAGEIGYVRALSSDRKYYVCDFPSTDGWKGRPQDLYVDNIATLVRPGKKVRVRSGITPKYRWGNVSPGQIGTVLRIGYDGDDCFVRFSADRNWRCRLCDLENIDIVYYITTTPSATSAPRIVSPNSTAGDIPHSISVDNINADASTVTSFASVMTAATQEQTFPDDCTVVIRGLNSAAGAPYNGKMAKVVSREEGESGRYRVEMLDENNSGSRGEIKSFKENNLMRPRQQHPNGMSVLLQNIRARGGSLNGKYGTITAFDPRSGRYTVRCEGGFFKLLPSKFDVISQIDEID